MSYWETKALFLSSKNWLGHRSKQKTKRQNQPTKEAMYQTKRKIIIFVFANSCANALFGVRKQHTERHNKLNRI
jgi:hypothetical protein